MPQENSNPRKVSEETLPVLREKLKPGNAYHAYENQAFGSGRCGHLKFLQVGPDFTYQEAPGRLPDTESEINWQYWHIGIVNTTTGEITAIKGK